MGEKFRKGFLKVMEPLEPYFETLDKTIMPVLKWFEKWIWLIGALVCLVIYIWKSIIHHYVDQYSIGQALSITFGEMLVIVLKIGLVVLISWSIFWLLGSILITWMNQNLEKRKAAEAISAPEQSTTEVSEEEPAVTPEQETPEAQIEEPQVPPAVHPQRSDTHGKALPVFVSDSLRGVFKPAFLATNPTNNMNSYEIFKEQLESQGWKISDLGRIALLVFESDILLSPYHSKGFNGWMKDFCFFIAREDDCPIDPDKSSYKDFWKSSSNLASVFFNLKTWYDKTGSDYICFEKPASESDRPS